MRTVLSLDTIAKLHVIPFSHLPNEDTIASYRLSLSVTLTTESGMFYTRHTTMSWGNCVHLFENRPANVEVTERTRLAMPFIIYVGGAQVCLTSMCDLTLQVSTWVLRVTARHGMMNMCIYLKIGQWILELEHTRKCG